MALSTRGRGQRAVSTCSPRRTRPRARPHAFNICLYSAAFMRSESSCVSRRWVLHNYLFMLNPPPHPRASLISSPSENRRFMKRGWKAASHRQPVVTAHSHSCPTGEGQAPAPARGTHCSSFLCSTGVWQDFATKVTWKCRESCASKDLLHVFVHILHEWNVNVQPKNQ